MIQIGDDVIIKVIETGPRWAKIGIEAPDNVRVIRAELFGRPGPQHPLAVFLEKRRLEKLRDSLLRDNVPQGNESTTDDRRARIDKVAAQPAPHLHPEY